MGWHHVYIVMLLMALYMHLGPFSKRVISEIDRRIGVAKGVFTPSQSSCHIAKVVLTLKARQPPIPIASDAPPLYTSRGFLGGLRTPAPECVAPPSWAGIRNSDIHVVLFDEFVGSTA